MKNDIYYKTWGYDKTVVSFVKLVSETEHFMFIKRLTKKRIENDQVLPDDICKLTPETYRISKKKFVVYDLWDGNPVQENRNYTYTGI